MIKQRGVRKNKEGAASFYIVAFSTLILVILAMSFAAVIISEVTRTSNDDLSQSAYDSALAGIEDAKLAYYNYQSCLETKADFTNAQVRVDGSITCEDIVAWVEKTNESVENMKSCDMVGHILGRIPEGGSGEVMIKETNEGGNTMQQYYTCVKIKTDLSSYKATLSESNTTRAVQVKLGNASAPSIDKVRVSWYSDSDGSEYAFTNFKSGAVTFPVLKEGKIATPPTLAVGIVQTAEVFSLSDFDKIASGRTDRGTVYLVPTDNSGWASGSKTPDNYIGVYQDDANTVSAEQIVKTNDRTVKNLPYAVYCNPDGGNEFACSADLELPKPIGGDRNENTFMIVVTIPYGQPSTDFALEFFCQGEKCGNQVVSGDDGMGSDGDDAQPGAANQATLRNMQVQIDSTGRANDLYRRVEARLDTADTYFPYPLYAIELLGDDSQSNLKKSLTVICEYNFDPTCP